MCVFKASPHKTMQNHMKIIPKSHFLTRHVRKFVESRTVDMSRSPGLVQDRSRKTNPCQQARLLLFFLRNYNFHFWWTHSLLFIRIYLFLRKSCVSLTNLWWFRTSSVLLNKASDLLRQCRFYLQKEDKSLLLDRFFFQVFTPFID